MHLASRDMYWDPDQCYVDNFGRRRCYRSAWDSWVRWVVLAVVLIGFALLVFLCSCITARRRRKAGRQPFYGTGWAARPGNAQPYYAGNNAATQPAPPYTPQPTGNSNTGYYGGANNSYYNGQQYNGQTNGVELQQPQPAYGGAQYQPPPGPPPGKGDGFVR